MNWDLFFKAASFALTILVGVYAFFANRRKDVDRRMSALEDRMKDVETMARNAPGKDELHAIGLTMAEIRGEFKVLSTEIRGQRDLMKRLDNVVNRHEDHLLSGSSK